MKKNLTLLTTAAMMAALTCIATMMIRVPTVGTNGYVNIGDTIVLLSAWMLGNPYGALAAGIGSGLADLLAGYGAYVPGTTVIKFAMAFVGFLVFKGFGKMKLPSVVGYCVSGVVAEAIMVLGYFLYESTILGYGLVALSAIPGNMIQGITCLVLGVPLVLILKKVPQLRMLATE
ncbi:MAG: ECF transporter S component [Lachnospiraceae bacterium]|nr:ECF transporter S component [Lachnospiraceae bacterium]